MTISYLLIFKSYETEILRFHSSGIRQTFGFVSLYEILIMENVSIPIANRETSSPFKGNAVKLAVNPKIPTNPRPQTAHPGAKIPKKIPMVPNTPVFPID